MDLSLVSLGQVQHDDQAQVGKDLEGAVAPPTSSGAAALGPALLEGSGVLGAPPGPPLPHLGMCGSNHQAGTSVDTHLCEHAQGRQSGTTYYRSGCKH
jgi:hypothetical protein